MDNVIFFRSVYTSFYPKDQFINVPLDLQPQESLLSLRTRCINVHLVKHQICIYAYRDVLPYTIAYICCSFAQSCPTLCNPMDCSMPVPCPLPFPGVCSNSSSLSRYAIQPSHPLSSVVPIPSCLQSFQVSGSFLLSQHIYIYIYILYLYNIHIIPV